jgi:hypothetical protein
MSEQIEPAPCRHCFAPLRFHRLATIRAKCDRASKGRGFEPMTPDEWELYEQMRAEQSEEGKP